MQARTGHLYAMGLLLTSFGSSIAIHQLYGECTALGVQVKASISVLIYRKALVLARIRGGAGEIINIMSTDVARIVEAVTNFHFLWSALVETILILALAFPTVGWAAALTAVILVLVVLPVQIYLGRLTSNIQIEQTAITTERVHLMSEILTAIKLIKFYAWETPFQEQINQVRAKELALFKRNLQVKAINMAVVFALPVIVAVSSLAVYNKRRTGLIDSSVVFTALSIFNTLRYPFLMLPIAVKSTSGARLALRRLDDFLTQPEVEPLKEYSVSEGGDTAIELIDGEFTWDGEDNGPALQGINLKVKRGEVIAIVGDVGSGKSSFVAALLGQIRQTGSGPKLKLYGKSSYVPQEAWLNNLTLRENIVFGKDFEEERYNTTVKVCALERDLTLLPHGDQTEIAERGSNLSGGQKQRVSLARAVYHKSDVILMDDPLSAVDQNVGKHIFDQCIRGYLTGRTVIIVTHQLQYLHRCDRIVMLQSGKIAYQGTYQELMANEPTFNTLINTHVSSEEEDDAIEVQEDSDSDDSDDDEVNPAALVGEDKSMDELGFADYVKYFRAGSGVLVTLLLIALFFVAHGIRIGSDYWLRLWVPNTLNTTDQVYLGVYGAFIAAFAVAVLFRGLWFAHEATLKSKELHDRAFKSVMRAPMSFFETTSLGRILSAFSKCMFTVDDTLPDAALLFLQYFPLALGAFLLIACVVHWQNAVTVIVLLLIALVVIWYGSPADSKLKQLEALSKPPVFQHITTTLEGLFSIRAYGVQKRFDGMNMDVLDKNHQSLYAMLTTKTWTAFYLDIISSLMVYSTALFLVIHRHTIHQVPSVAGLALSNALQMLVFLQWTVRQMGEVQAQISVVGQLDYYGRMIEPEAPAENPATKPDASWPQEGRIDFDHLVLSYRKNTPPVLKDVSFTINPKEKVGIVGRTGSGKSTLLVGLLRIVEATSGAILIDGVDISKIGLKDLRTKVGIIPQEPVLFVGTIRTNLDPFGQYEDNAIWRALDAVHLGEKVKEMPLKLDSPVIEHGKNFSLGQRQLICIARSLVIGSKIIVLDEATASIDMVTDRLLQETIKESFADCTVLTIAHRLNTIIESDKVLVMDGGVVAEFGEPHKLLQDPNGIFAELVSHAGEAASKKLANIAEEAHKDRNNGLDLVMEEVENEKALEREEAEAASAAHSPVQVELAVVDPALAEPYIVDSSVSAAAAPMLQVPASANGSPKAETEGLAKAKAHLRQLSSTSGMFDTGVVSIPTSPIPTASATGSTSPPFPSKGEAAVEKQFERLFRNPSAGDTPDGSPEMKPQTTTTPSTEPADDIHLSRSE
ncbi:MAG: P-loop containing nucleoside triphosphate hydrolase protein [Linnemannia gamsii]|nr:MAG: P-loop containing nucleoside triphosphate hydrolase protein [Linnemannia gamsii]